MNTILLVAAGVVLGLLVFAVVIASESDPETPVAHVTGSYALPQAR